MKHKHCIAVVVWGDTYIRQFLDYSIPSLLAPNNLPNLKNKESFELLIWTSEVDVKNLESTPEIAEIERHVRVKIRSFPSYLFLGGKREDRYWRMSSLHRGIIEYCEDQRAGILFLPSDAIWSDGSLSNIEKIIDQGKKVIVMCSLRVDDDSTLKSLEPYTEKARSGRDGKVKKICISSRDLMQVTLDNMHGETKSRFINSQRFTFAPAHIYWDLGGKGLLVRAVHLHPVYIRPDNYVTDFETTFDADFLNKAVPDSNDYYLCEDSDDMFFVDLTNPKDLATVPLEPRTAALSEIAPWMAKHASKTHRLFLNTPIWMHTQIDRSQWQDEVDRSKEFTLEMQELFKEFDDAK
jgi:hypothetical protein